MSLSKDQILSQLRETVAQLRAIEERNENIREKDGAMLQNHIKIANDKGEECKLLSEKSNKKFEEIELLSQQADKIKSQMGSNNASADLLQNGSALMNQIQASFSEVNQILVKTEHIKEDIELQTKIMDEICKNQDVYKKYRELLEEREICIRELKNLNVDESEILAAADLSPKIKSVDALEKRKTLESVAVQRKQAEEKALVDKEAWSRIMESTRKTPQKHTRPKWTLAVLPVEKITEDNQPAIRDCFNLTGELKPGMYTNEKFNKVRLNVDENGYCRFSPAPRNAQEFEKCWRDLLRSFSVDIGTNRVELNYRVGEKANFDQILKILDFAKDEKLIIDFNDIIKDQLKQANPKLQAIIWAKVHELEAQQKQILPLVHQYESTLLCEKNIKSLASTLDEAKKMLPALSTGITSQQGGGQSDGIKGKLQTLSEMATKMDVSIDAVNKELSSVPEGNHAKFKESVGGIKVQCDNLVDNMHRLQLKVTPELDSAFGKAERQLKEVSEQVSKLNSLLEGKMQADCPSSYRLT